MSSEPMLADGDGEVPDSKNGIYYVGLVERAVLTNRQSRLLTVTLKGNDSLASTETGLWPRATAESL
jgi:hypothetical protein